MSLERGKKEIGIAEKRKRVKLRRRDKYFLGNF